MSFEIARVLVFLALVAISVVVRAIAGTFRSRISMISIYVIEKKYRKQVVVGHMKPRKLCACERFTFTHMHELLFKLSAAV